VSVTSVPEWAAWSNNAYAYFFSHIT